MNCVHGTSQEILNECSKNMNCWAINKKNYQKLSGRKTVVNSWGISTHELEMFCIIVFYSV